MAYHRNPRGDARRRRREEQILKAARRLLVRHGYDATTMQQIATAARTSIGNLYFYYPSKDALLRTLLDQAMEAEWALADTIANRLPPGPARLAVMVLRNADWLLARDREITRILLESATTRRVADWVALRNGTRLVGYLIANAADRLGADPAGTAALWGGAGRGYIEASLQGDPAIPATQRAEVLLRWNLRALGLADGEIDEAIAVAHDALAAAAATV